MQHHLVNHSEAFGRSVGQAWCSLRWPRDEMCGFHAAMSKLLLPACLLSMVFLACSGGGGGASKIDPDAECSLTGELYDAYYNADGAGCGGEGYGYCRQGDRCVSDGVCEFVISATADATCDMIGVEYDAFYEANGISCGGEGYGYCMEGDRCASDGVCEAVLSMAGRTVHAILFEAEYSAFYEANGISCGGEGYGYCMEGDRCASDGLCKAVLSATGGVLDASKVGAAYDPYYEANGISCGGEGFGYCQEGDLCRADVPTCEVVLSAITR